MVKKVVFIVLKIGVTFAILDQLGNKLKLHNTVR